AQGLDELRPNLLDKVRQIGPGYVKGTGITAQQGVTGPVKPLPRFDGDAGVSLAPKTALQIRLRILQEFQIEVFPGRQIAGASRGTVRRHCRSLQTTRCRLLRAPLYQEMRKLPPKPFNF